MSEQDSKQCSSPLPQVYPEGSDAYFMAIALQAATKAGELGEVPVGGVIVREGRVLATAHNSPISGCDPTAHAEIILLRRAAEKLDNYRLVDCELFVTLEPCLMCFGAMVHARIKRLVFGALEPRSGVVASQLKMHQAPFLNHRLEVQGGLLAEHSAQLLRDFFSHKRRSKNSP